MSAINAPRRIRRLAIVLALIGAAFVVTGTFLWIGELDHGFAVTNNRDDFYRNLQMGPWQLGLRNEVRTCHWQPAPVIRGDPDFRFSPDGYRVADSERMAPHTMSSRLQYSLTAECVAPTIMIYTHYVNRLQACGSNANCAQLEHSNVMLRAQTIALRKFSFMDCRDEYGIPRQNCTERSLLREALAGDLRQLRSDPTISNEELEQTATGIVNSCLSVTGEVCRETSSFVRSDWQAVTSSLPVAVGLWTLGLSLALFLMGPLLWLGIGAVVKWIFR